MLTILIVEDSEDDAFLLRRALDREGFKSSVQLVCDGRQAVKYLRGEGDYSDRHVHPFPDVVFTDLKMPGLDGFGVLKWLKSHPECKLLPTMVLTSSNEDEDINKAYGLGANAYLVKPGTLAELQKLVRTVHEFWNRCAKPNIPIAS